MATKKKSRAKRSLSPDLMCHENEPEIPKSQQDDSPESPPVTPNRITAASPPTPINSMQELVQGLVQSTQDEEAWQVPGRNYGKVTWVATGEDVFNMGSPKYLTLHDSAGDFKDALHTIVVMLLRRYDILLPTVASLAPSGMTARDIIVLLADMCDIRAKEYKGFVPLYCDPLTTEVGASMVLSVVASLAVHFEHFQFLPLITKHQMRIHSPGQTQIVTFNKSEFMTGEDMLERCLSFKLPQKIPGSTEWKDLALRYLCVLLLVYEPMRNASAAPILFGDELRSMTIVVHAHKSPLTNIISLGDDAKNVPPHMHITQYATKDLFGAQRYNIGTATETVLRMLLDKDQLMDVFWTFESAEQFSLYVESACYAVFGVSLNTLSVRSLLLATLLRAAKKRDYPAIAKRALTTVTQLEQITMKFQMIIPGRLF